MMQAVLSYSGGHVAYRAERQAEEEAKEPRLLRVALDWFERLSETQQAAVMDQAEKMTMVAPPEERRRAAQEAMVKVFLEA